MLLAGAGTWNDRSRLRAARRIGRALGLEGAPARRRTSLRADARALISVLEERGFEPSTGKDGVTRLRNCPFHALAREHRTTVCPLNLALLRGVVDGVGAASLAAVPDDPGEGCCVAFRPRVRGEV